MKQNWIRRLPQSTELIYLSCIIILILIFTLSFRPLQAAIAFLGLSGMWGVASYLSFRANLFIPGLLATGIIGPILYIGATLSSSVRVRRSQRSLYKAFELYLSPQLAGELSRNTSTLSLGGEDLVATALFTDIADFTRISEKMKAVEVTQMLNDYFSEMVDAVFDKNGTLIKFIGDAIFALWGAPVKIKDHGDKAVEAALLMRKKLQESSLLKSYPPLITRIGIHTGQMVVGNLGSRKRFDFTAIGDSVNLASRIEGLNKYLGTTLLLTDSTKSTLSKDYHFLYMGKVRVVGKEEAVGLYTIPEIEIEPIFMEKWIKALSFFEQGSLKDAESTFKNIKESNDYLSKAAELYIEQIAEYGQDTSIDNWHGELIVTSK